MDGERSPGSRRVLHRATDSLPWPHTDPRWAQDAIKMESRWVQERGKMRPEWDQSRSTMRAR
ncbi:hypothetical protein SMMN14_07861 [Sphaerulina musiva]